MEYAIETHGLSKTYKGKIQALAGMDLQVPVGSCFGLLGPNGAGKSTLVKVLLSIVHPTHGDATLLGQDFRDPEARREVGYLPEGHRFPRYLTGGALCTYFGQLAGLHGSSLRKQVDEKLGLVGMSEWKKTKVAKYSKGMMQRVGLAQAMLGDPKLIFLDEPTDGVDPLGRRQIKEMIQTITKAGTTVFLNSHLLGEVQQICDQIAILHHGEVLKQGSVEEVIGATTDTESRVVRFGVNRIHEKVWTWLEGQGARKAEAREGEEAFTLTLRERPQITQVIDALRKGESEIYSVDSEEKDLEQAFVDLIKEHGEGVGGHAGAAR